MRFAMCVAAALTWGLWNCSEAAAGNVVAVLNQDVLTISGSDVSDSVMIVQFIGRTTLIAGSGTTINNQRQVVFTDDVNHVDADLGPGIDSLVLAFSRFSSLDVILGTGTNSLGLFSTTIQTSSFAGSGQDLAVVLGGRLTRITASSGFSLVVPRGALNPR